LRHDLEILVAEAHSLGCYTNLITSGVGLDEARVRALRKAGLDQVQLAFQAPTAELCNYMAGRDVFQQKLEAARLIKEYDFPMVLNFVIYRQNIDQTSAFLELAGELKADYVEFANTLMYSWAWVNRAKLAPTLEQLRRSEAIVNEYRSRYKGKTKIYYVIPDYFEGRPKACLRGWGDIFFDIAPDGTAMPCQLARQLPGLEFSNVRERDLRWIWEESPAFNRFRGDDWMKEPCRSCPERHKDFGGCRCQAFMLTGDAANPDPACHFVPDHQKIVDLAMPSITGRVQGGELIFRNARNSLALGQ
jgi:pyrroloquinoline quinone biosynthesis protein E